MVSLEKKCCSSGLLDFHTHSVYSDGADTPKALVERAKKAGVSAMALTDHNVISGLEEFNLACNEAGIIAVPFGVEIYAELPKDIPTKMDNDAPDLVMLGRNPKKDTIKDYHDLLLKDRRERWLPRTIEALRKIGFSIPTIDLVEQSSTLGVPKILHDFIYYGNNLEKLIEYVKTIQPEVKPKDTKKQPIKYLNKYIYAIGCPAYIKRLEGFNVSDAIRLADAMNCRLFIAHPGGEYGCLSDFVLDYYIKTGIHGIEVRSYFNTHDQNKKFDKLAKDHKLIRSGGSDCHGSNGPFKIGMYDRLENQLQKDVLEELWYSLPK